jgi:hypothetical protein
MADEIAVEHDPAGSRFVARLDGQEATLKYRMQGTVIDFYHTYVPPVFRGRGIAERLCRTGFEYAKGRGLSVIPSCPYVAETYLKRHPEYEPLTRR